MMEEKQTAEQLFELNLFSALCKKLIEKGEMDGKTASYAGECDDLFELSISTAFDVIVYMDKVTPAQRKRLR